MVRIALTLSKPVEKVLKVYTALTKSSILEDVRKVNQ